MARAIGFVYVLTNTAMPSLVKVGMSGRLAEDRARELSTTGVPVPFEVAFRFATSFPLQVERRAHQILVKDRYNKDREFFAVTPEVAISAVRRAALEVAGIDEWEPVESQPPTTVIQSADRVALTLRAGQLFFVFPYRPRTIVLMERLKGIPPAPPIETWQAHSDGDLLELMATESPERVSGFGPGDEAGIVDPVPYLARDNTALNGALIGKERLSPGSRVLWMEQRTKWNGTTPIAFAVFEFASYCQVTCRTWTPKRREDGVPLILNTPLIDPTPTMIDVAKVVSRSASIDVDARFSQDSLAQEDFGRIPDDPEYWLSQLTRQRRDRKAQD